MGRIRRIGLVAVMGVTTAVALACGRGAFSGGGETGSPSGTTTTTPILPTDFGTGRDGPLSVPSGSSTINKCVPLTSAAGGRAVLTAGNAAFTKGVRVLLLQAHATFGTFGDQASVTNAGTAGRWEIATITTANGATLSLSPLLVHSYVTAAATDMAEVCTVPEYTTASIAGDVAASNWTPASGHDGVVAFFVASAFTFSGSITADKSGFKGGVVSQNGNGTCGDMAGGVTDNNYGQIGEGLAIGTLTHYGRLDLSNGAGGANPENSGGGGGGGGGAGGAGGNQNQTDCSMAAANGGQGGAAISLALPDFLTMGGGGGGGHQNDGNGTDGADGGGIILVFAKSITGAGVMQAIGDTASNASNDGAGGGGAGGTIMVIAGDATGFTGTLDVHGGDGGDTSDASGPGGGGGGGRIYAMVPHAHPQPLLFGGAAGAGGTNSAGETPGFAGVAFVMTGATFAQ